MNAFNFAKNLRMVRQSKELKQELIADEVGMSQTRYSRIERGLANATDNEIAAFALALNVPLSELMPPLGVKDYKALRAMQVAQMFLKTHFGLVIIFGAASALINSVFNFALGICDGYDASVATRTWVSWTAVVATVLYLRYGYRKFISMYKDNQTLS